MKNKNLIIGLGVLAVAGIAYYMWKKNSEEYSNAESVALFGFTKKRKKGTKICNCPPGSPGGYGDKQCSKSMTCKDCCAGSGLGDI